MPIVLVSCSWLIGILVGVASTLPLVWGLTSLGPVVTSLFFPRTRRLLALSSVCIAALFAGVLCSRSVQSSSGDDRLQTYNGTGEVTIEGYVSRAPELGRESTQISLSAMKIAPEGTRLDVSGTALVTVPRYPAHRYGDILIVTGELIGRPRAAISSTNESAYWDYLANQDIHSAMFYPEVEVAPGFEGWAPLRWLYASRDSLVRMLERVLPEPQAALAEGITLGIRANIPSDLKTDFTRTGTAHLLAISGVNLTIVAGMLVILTVRLFGRRHYPHIWLTLIIIWLYTWLTGMGAPVVRAAIMVTVFLAAELLGRQRSAFIALLLAAAIMAGINPTLLFDASFQLSFAAMAGLVFVFPLLQSLGDKLVERAPEGRPRALCASVAASFEVSLAAVVATWPLTAHYFGIFSWVGPAATFFAMPVMPAIIATTMGAAVFGLVFLPLGQAVAWLAWLPLSYLMLVVTRFGALSAASSAVVISTPLVAGYYAVLALITYSCYRRGQLVAFAERIAFAICRLPVKWVVPPLSVAALLAWLTFLSMPDNNLHVSFLDVGQGDAILIEKGSLQVLIDGGPDPQPVIVEMSKKMAFWDRNIDMVILTHPDADHLGGLVEVLKRYRVQKIVATNVTDDSPLFEEWQDLVQSRPGRFCAAGAGQTISLGADVSLSVLSPDPTAVSEGPSSLNEGSVVVRMAMGDVSFLLTGDLPTGSEDELIMERAHLSSTVLKVAHHGSATSTGEAFLDVVRPQVAVISVGKDNNYAHPNEDVLARLGQEVGVKNIYRTDQQGTIEFITDGRRLWVRTQR